MRAMIREARDAKQHRSRSSGAKRTTKKGPGGLAFIEMPAARPSYKPGDADPIGMMVEDPSQSPHLQVISSLDAGILRAVAATAISTLYHARLGQVMAASQRVVGLPNSESKELMIQLDSDWASGCTHAC